MADKTDRRRVKGGKYQQNKTGTTKLVRRTTRPRRGVDERTEAAWKKPKPGAKTGGENAQPAADTEAAANPGTDGSEKKES